MRWTSSWLNSILYIQLFVYVQCILHDLFLSTKFPQLCKYNTDMLFLNNLLSRILIESHIKNVVPNILTVLLAMVTVRQLDNFQLLPFKEPVLDVRVHTKFLLWTRYGMKLIKLLFKLNSIVILLIPIYCQRFLF